MSIQKHFRPYIEGTQAERGAYSPTVVPTFWQDTDGAQEIYRWNGNIWEGWGLPRRRDATLTPVDHFEATSLDAAWSWAGAPFVTPGSVSISDSNLYVGNFPLAADRGFLYRALPTFSYVSAAIGLVSFSVGFAGGVRLDDGTDNNYVEVVIYLQASAPDVWRVQRRRRVGGGAIATSDGGDLIVPLAYIADMQVFGTKWTNWNQYTRLMVEWSLGAAMFAASGSAGLTWAPTRIGLVFDQGGVSTAAWNAVIIDFYDHR